MKTTYRQSKYKENATNKTQDNAKQLLHKLITNKTQAHTR